jgi:trimeric autotransporter adhesin
MDTRMMRLRSLVRSGIGIALVACLALACTDTPTGTTATTTYTVGGTVAGLAGSGLVLRDNGGDDLPVSANGLVTFGTPMASGAAYDVTVFTQPTSPTQSCVVTGGSGTIGNGNVTTVAIVCTTGAYTVGGTITGLAGSGLVLQDNGGDDLAVSANGAFTFTTPLTTGTAYSVTVFAQPTNPAQACAVTGGSGVVANANVTNVAIQCAMNGTYTVGGTVSGLAGSRLALRNNNGEILSVAANGPFTFTTPLPTGTAYDVTVFTQPTTPAQTCVVSSGRGTLSSGNVTSVAVVCTTGAYTVGGTITGLGGSGLVLQDNGRDDLAVSANGGFSFTTPLTTGTAYSVTVFTQPTNPAQTCVVTEGSGTVATANVTTVAIVCSLGAVRVTASTAGANAPATYTVDADPGSSGSSTAVVPVNGTVSFDLPPGAHTVRLTVAANCTVASPNPVTATVASGATTDIAFAVTCTAIGTIQVTVATTGINAPVTYGVNVRLFDPYGGAHRSYHGSVPSNGTVSVAVVPGPYSVTLSVPLNCHVTPNSGGVGVVAGATRSITFTVTCVSAGTLGVTVATTGPNAPTTYTLGVYPYWGTSLYSAPIFSNGTATLLLPVGSETVLLVVPPNCTVTSPNNVSVNIQGGMTSNLVFTAVCR